MSWSTTCIRSPTWQHCPCRGPFSYTTSTHVKRSTFVDTFSTSWPRASPEGTQGQSCHSPLSSWASLQRQVSRFQAVSPLCQEIIPLVLILWLEAELTSSDPKLASLKYPGIMLRKRVEILKKRLKDSPQHQKVLLNHPLKHKHEDPIVWIVSWHG